MATHEIPASQVGCPNTLTPEIIKRLVHNAPRVFTTNQIAALSSVPRTNLQRWLEIGEEDHRTGQETIFAQLWAGINQAKAAKCDELLQKLMDCAKNYGAITWVLEKCFKDDFENKSDAHKKLEDYVLNVIGPMIRKGEMTDETVRTEEAQITETAKIAESCL